MAYARFHNSSLNDTFDEFLFANYPESNSKEVTIFSCLEDYLNKHNDSLKNTTVVATEGVTPMLGCYKGFSGFLEERVPTVHTVQYVLHLQHLVAKNLSG